MALVYSLTQEQRTVKCDIISRFSFEKLGKVYQCFEGTKYAKMLEESCFGKILNVKDLVANQIIHHLIMRLAMPWSKEADVFWFRVGSNKIRFIKQEFCLVSGFLVGDENQVDKTVGKECRLVKKHFGGHKKLDRNIVLEKFLSMRNSLDRYKLGLIVILTYVVWPSEERRVLEWWLFQLVDDLDAFNKYPWGNQSYKYTTQVLRRDYTETFKGKLVSYPLHGFPHAVKVWAFEAIPSLRKFTEIVNENALPRMLKWGAAKRVLSPSVELVLGKEELEAIRVLVPTEAEKEEIYCYMLPEGDDAVEVDDCKGKSENKDVEMNVEANKEEEEGAVEVDALVRSSSRSNKRAIGDEEQANKKGKKKDVAVDGHVSSPSTNKKVRFCMEFVNEMSKEVQPVQARVTRSSSTGGKEKVVVEEVKQAMVSSSTGGKEKVAVEEVKPPIIYSRVLRSQVLKKNELASSTGGKEKVVVEEVKPPIICSRVLRSQVLKKKKNELVSFSTVVNEEEQVVEEKEVVEENVVQVDEEETVANLDLLKELTTPVMNNVVCLKSTPDKLLIKLRYRHVEARILKDILKGESLSDQIVNDALCELRRRCKASPKLYDQDAVVMDSTFSMYLKTFYNNKAKMGQLEDIEFPKTFHNYANGTSPEDGKPVAGCKTLYLPVLEGDHWFLVKVDVENKKLYVYDSLAGYIRNTALTRCLISIQVMVPCFLRKLVAGFENYTVEKLVVEKVKNCPTQENGSDCGMFVLMFIEALLAKLDLGLIKSDQMKKWRERLVAQLYSAA